MFRIKDRSLVVTSSIVLALLLVIVISVTEYLSYSSQKKSYLDEIERIGQTLGYQIEAGHDLVTFGYNEVSAGRDTNNATFKTLKLQLDVMIKNDIVANAYVYMPEVIERDGKKFIKMMQSNESLSAAGLGPGDEYEMSDEFAGKIDDALNEGSALTDAVTDEYGQWISYLARVKDPSGKLIGIFGIDVDFKQIDDALNLMFWKSIGIAALLAFIAILIIVALVRMTLKPLKRLAEVSSLAAKGDLTLAVAVKGGNEIAQVSIAFNEMIASLRQLTGSIRITSDEVAGSAFNMQQRPYLV